MPPSRQTLDLLVGGDLNADVIIGPVAAPRAGEEHLAAAGAVAVGGSAASCAVNAARLGLRVALAACVGRDPLGDFLLAELAAAGVSTRWVRRHPRLPTGFTVNLNTRGAQDKAQLTFPGALAALRPEHVAPAAARARHLHLASYFVVTGLQSAAPRLFRAARRAGLTTSLDPNPDPANQYQSGLAAAAAACDFFLPNLAEARGLTAAASLHAVLLGLRRRCRAVVLKCGPRGAMYVDATSALRFAPPPARALDPTGAGDSLNAGFLAAWLQGATLAAAIEFGQVCAAATCSALGGSAGIARRQLALRRRLARLPRRDDA